MRATGEREASERASERGVSDRESERASLRGVSEGPS